MRLLRRLSSLYRPIRTFTTEKSYLDERFEELVREVCPEESTVGNALLGPAPSTLHQSSHDVLVLHPKIRWGENSPSRLKDPQRQLDEAVTLVGTLPGFRVVDSHIIGTDYNTKKKAIWGSGRLERLLQLKEEQRITALMINVDMLSPMQQMELHSIFGVPVFDRYNIVLSIFRHFARTPEARLQIALAEIPYIKARLRSVAEHPETARILHVERPSEKASADKFEVLRLREQWLRKRLKEATEEATKAAGEAGAEHALVAVVGYTNAGKTTLVKKLTGAECLQPQDRLFATLDTTRHPALLPSGRPVVFADTIGFLSDLPTHLLAAFHATLAHVRHAQVVVHVRDVSNPSWRAQSDDVEKTLDTLGVRAGDGREMVTVDNKVDKEGAESEETGALRISCVTGEGMPQLIEQVDRSVLSSTGCRIRRLRLSPSSPAVQLLYSMGAVGDRTPEVDKDGKIVFQVAMTDGEFEQFKKRAGISLKKKQ